MQTGLKKKHPKCAKCAKQFYLQASYDCAINIYTTVVFASNLSFLKCRHAGSVFTERLARKVGSGCYACQPCWESQKGWLWLLCMPAMLMMSQKGWLWLLCMPAMLMMSQKGWLWLLCMPAMLMMSQKGWLWLLCMPAMLMMSEIPTAKHKMAAFAVVFSGLSMSVFNKPDYKPTEKHT